VNEHWYIYCRSQQLKSKPLPRTIFGQALVAFRARDGALGVLADRCAHRNLALSRGRVVEKGLSCAYHGWTWSTEGRCVYIPASCQDCSAYAQIKVRQYPVEESQGFLWVWMGPADSTPSAKPMLFPRFADQGWHHWVMEREFEGSAFNCVENFLDVPHTAHVHRGLFRGAEAKLVEIEITSGANWIQAEFLEEERMESLIGRLLFKKEGAIVHTDRFQLPYVTRVDYRMAESRQYIVMSQCTPIDDERTRVFTYMAYRFDPFGLAVRLIFEPLSHLILNQDIVIVREQAEDLRRTGTARFIYWETDAIAKGIRRLLDGESLANEAPQRKRLKV
jgi:phenylpropionate dioxygenase-like ring-hydroxylating dioxygenase large terminal subunit